MDAEAGEPAGCPGYPLMARGQVIVPAQDQGPCRHADEQAQAEDPGCRHSNRNYDAGHQALPAVLIARGSAFLEVFHNVPGLTL
jgi:hypothetical protein